MKKTKFQKVLGRKPNEIRIYKNNTGRKNKNTGAPIFEELLLLDFTERRRVK